MILQTHPDLRLRKLTIGAEQAPLLVIDNFIADPDRLVRKAAGRQFTVPSRFYPGIRAEAPPSYRQLIETRLRNELFEHFGLQGASLRFSMSHYSLVTTPPEKLTAIQRIPHVDSLNGTGLATIHYLFKTDLGGTAFYRHRKTGFEYVDETRADTYFGSRSTSTATPRCSSRSRVRMAFSTACWSTAAIPCTPDASRRASYPIPIP